MTEKNTKVNESIPESTNATPGQQLKKGRENKGLTQKEVADRLHLRLGNVEDIESDTHQPGVSLTFTKGYVRIYAKLLGMPVEPLLEAFDVLHQGDKQAAKLQSFSQRVAKQANDDRWMMVTYLIAFLVVASLVIWWYQQSDSSIVNRLDLFDESTTEQQSNSNEIEETEPVNLISNNQFMSNELAIPEDEVKQQVADSTNDSKLQSLGNSLTQAADTADELTNDSAAQNSNPFLNDATIESEDLSAVSNIKDGYTVNDDGTVELIFTFNEDCWLSVTDVNDEVMAVGVKVKGRVMSVSGIPPISVNLCPPDNVAINFAGNPVDLSSYPSGTPVKFELKVTGE